MENVILDWSLLPAKMFTPLDMFKGEEGFYYPFFGSGVYLFVYPTKAGYQVFYVGQAEKIGCRFVEHIEHYLGKRTPRYYIPTSIDYFNKNVYECFRLENYKGKLSNDTSDFTGENYSEIGKKIIDNTWLCFAKLHKKEKTYREEIETVLILAVLKQNNLPKMKWIGDGHLTPPDRDIEIINYYDNDIIRNIIGKTLPEKIKYIKEDGVIF